MSSLYIELVFVVDHGVYKFLDEDIYKAYKLCKDVVNILNSVRLYLLFNNEHILSISFCSLYSVSIR